MQQTNFTAPVPTRLEQSAEAQSIAQRSQIRRLQQGAVRRLSSSTQFAHQLAPHSAQRCAVNAGRWQRQKEQMIFAAKSTSFSAVPAMASDGGNTRLEGVAAVVATATAAVILCSAARSREI